jgi:hypothetical protein
MMASVYVYQHWSIGRQSHICSTSVCLIREKGVNHIVTDELKPSSRGRHGREGDFVHRTCDVMFSLEEND